MICMRGSVANLYLCPYAHAHALRHSKHACTHSASTQTHGHGLCLARTFPGVDVSEYTVQCGSFSLPRCAVHTSSAGFLGSLSMQISCMCIVHVHTIYASMRVCAGYSWKILQASFGFITMRLATCELVFAGPSVECPYFPSCESMCMYGSLLQPFLREELD